MGPQGRGDPGETLWVLTSWYVEKNAVHPGPTEDEVLQQRKGQGMRRAVLGQGV